MPIDFELTQTLAGTPLVRTVSRGLVSLEEAQAMMARLGREGQGRFLLSLIQRDVRMPPETRKIFAGGGLLGAGPRAVAVVFESSIQRATVATIMLFVTMPEAQPMKTFGEEAEARAWLDTRASKSP